MSDVFAYSVEVEKVDPPVGENQFVARVPYLIKNPDGDYIEHVHTTFQEHWGKTEDEARDKAKAEAEAWISEQHDSKSQFLF